MTPGGVVKPSITLKLGKVKSLVALALKGVFKSQREMWKVIPFWLFNQLFLIKLLFDVCDIHSSSILCRWHLVPFLWLVAKLKRPDFYQIASII